MSTLASWWFNVLEEPLVFYRNWYRGIVGTVTGTNIISARFDTATNLNTMEVDGSDIVFSTNFDTTISGLEIYTVDTSAGDTVSFEVSYGPNLDSETGKHIVWRGTTVDRETRATLPRPFLLPKGNYLHLKRISGTGGNTSARFSGVCVMSQTVPTLPEISGDMQGNLP